MSDYCDCGSLANARCRCGATVCSLHTENPQPHHNTALMIAARKHEGRSEHALFTALNDAWSSAPSIMCGRCYARTIVEVAARYAAAFRKHTDARAETIASTLLGSQSWTTGREFHSTETIGQMTLRAAGHLAPWSHPDPLDTAGRLYASTHGEPPDLPVRMVQFTERKKLFGGKERVESLVTWGSIRAWAVTAKFTDDGYPNSATILVGASGARKESPNSNPVDGKYFYSSEQASEAKSVLEGAFFPLPTPGFFFIKEQALAVALGSSL